LINKGKGELYVIQRPNGLIIRLRAFSSSAGKTGAKWTVDVVHPSINNGGAVEMKFK
jgi:filamentous hemagglutinin